MSGWRSSGSGGSSPTLPTWDGSGPTSRAGSRPPARSRPASLAPLTQLDTYSTRSIGQAGPRLLDPGHASSAKDSSSIPMGLDLDPTYLGQLDPTFHLALHAGRAAWQRPPGPKEVDRSRVGVVFGNIVLPTEAASSIAPRRPLGRTFEEASGDRSPTLAGPSSRSTPGSRACRRACSPGGSAWGVGLTRSTRPARRRSTL